MQGRTLEVKVNPDESICEGCGYIRHDRSFYDSGKWLCSVCKHCRESMFSSVDRWTRSGVYGSVLTLRTREGK